MEQPPPQPAAVPMQPAPQPQMMMFTPNNPSGPTPPTIRRIKFRHTMFKVGVGGLFFSALLFIVGFSIPAWGNKSGLWMSCFYGHCGTNVGVGPDWLDAVRAMESLALVCFLVCVAVELYQDVFKSPPPRDNKAVEILGIASGVLGLIGITVYGAKTSGTWYRYETYGSSSYRVPYHIYLSWGFGLAAAGSILIIICSILIAVSRSRHATLADQALGAFPVPQSSSGAVPMQPMMPPPMSVQYPYMQTYPYMNPYHQPYGVYPAPATAPFMTPAPPAAGPSSGAPVQGMPTSQVPAFYVIVQGQMVPVYKEMPMTTAPAITTDQTQVPDASGDDYLNQKQ